MSYPLHAYSERGVINAVFETIAAVAYENQIEGNRLMEALLGKVVRWKDGKRIEHKDLVLKDFEIYVEHSLSDFGDADVIVFADYGHIDDSKPHWGTFFIEAKREPFVRSSPPDKPDEFYIDNESTILHQLFLKFRFWETHIKEKTELPHKPVTVYSGIKRKSKRRIGDVAMVHNLADKILKRQEFVWFVSLTTDPPPKFKSGVGTKYSEDEWKSWAKPVVDQFLRVCELNFKDGTGWGSKVKATESGKDCQTRSCLLSWDDVWDWAGEPVSPRVRQALRDNRSKFTFWDKRENHFPEN